MTTSATRGDASILLLASHLYLALLSSGPATKRSTFLDLDPMVVYEWSILCPFLYQMMVASGLPP